MENNQTEEKKKSGNKLFVILSAVFFGLSCFLAYQLYNQKTITQVVIQEKEKVSDDYNNVKVELDEVQKAYADLNTNNKQLQSELDAKREELAEMQEKLEKAKGDAYMISKLKKELQTIRNLIKSYLHDIDSLNTLNIHLRKENQEKDVIIAEEQSKTQKLNQEKQQLNATIELGARLKAQQLFADAVRSKSNNREETTTRSKRAEKIRSCFVLSENPIAKKEEKVLYMKITGPDGRVLSNGVDESNTFTINGEKLLFSAKKEVSYDNKEKEVCMYFTKREDFPAGKYKVEIYVDGGMAGTTSVELK